MIAATTSQELNALREESDWVATQLERLQQVVLHVSSAAQAERQPLG
jgi:hypothetical protein